MKICYGQLSGHIFRKKRLYNRLKRRGIQAILNIRDSTASLFPVNLALTKSDRASRLLIDSAKGRFCKRAKGASLYFVLYIILRERDVLNLRQHRSVAMVNESAVKEAICVMILKI